MRKRRTDATTVAFAVAAPRDPTLHVDLDSDIWKEARDRASDLRQVVGEDATEGARVAEIAKRWGVSRATVWRKIRSFREDAGVRGLLSQRRGPPKGTTKLPARVEELIAEVARRWWRECSENATIAEILPSILEECRARELPVPSRATVGRRLAALRRDPSNFSGSARRVLGARRRLIRGHYQIREPLSVVQMDHTVADVFVVDRETRESIGRPTLTVAIDVASRCVLGYCISLEAPSALLVALCLEHAVFPKEGWLRDLGLKLEWPMYGRPRALHSDNGREFHSAAFRRGCDLNAIDIIHRPPATPRFGGHIERLIGTLMRRVRLLPGSSYSDLLGQHASRAEQQARLTLADLQAFLATDIATYHSRTHRALGRSPRSAWEAAWQRREGSARIPVPCDRERFRCEFLPLQRRVVGREGIELFGLEYSSLELAAEVALGVSRVVRFDPRDLSRIYLERPDQTPLTVPLRDPPLVPLSWWEWRSTRRAMRRGEPCTPGMAPAIPPTVTPALSARRQRRFKARQELWREVQRSVPIAAAPLPLQPSLASPEADGRLAWEMLE